MVIFYDKSSRSRKIFVAPGPKRINIAHLPQNCPQGSQHCNLPSNCPLNRLEGPLPHMMSKLAKTNMAPLPGISDVYVFVLLEAYSQASESKHLGWSDHFCTAPRSLWLCLFEISFCCWWSHILNRKERGPTSFVGNYSCCGVLGNQVKWALE